MRVDSRIPSPGNAIASSVTFTGDERIGLSQKAMDKANSIMMQKIQG
jgi:hypothetical protein